MIGIAAMWQNGMIDMATTINTAKRFDIQPDDETSIRPSDTPYDDRIQKILQLRDDNVNVILSFK